MTTNPGPTNVTIYGRLSFPTLSYAAAVARNAKGQYPKDAAEVAPEFHMLVEKNQLDKFITHVTGEFLPYCLAQAAAKETKNALSQKEIAQIMEIINTQAWDAQPPYISVKPVSEKTKPMMPTAEASIKVVGTRGVDIQQRAIVRNETQLAVPDPDRLKYPFITSIDETNFTLYGGCWVNATLNLYSFVSGKFPGFSASASIVVFREDDDRFGGGVAIDEEAMFED
jgi:hypothetical protein